jgi:hypothetical protein
VVCELDSTETDCDTTFLEHWNQLFQEVGLTEIVALADPNEIAAAIVDALSPLAKDIAGIPFIEDGADTIRMAGAVSLDDCPAFVYRTIVEDENLNVAVSLAKYRFDPLLEKGSVVVVRNDGRNLSGMIRGFGPLSIGAR